MFSGFAFQGLLTPVEKDGWSSAFSGEDVKPSSLPLMDKGATAMPASQPQQNGSALSSPVVQPFYSHFFVVVVVRVSL